MQGTSAVAAVALLMGLAYSAPVCADQPVSIIINIDVLPDRVADGKTILQQEGQLSRRDAGFITWQLLQRTDHENHFAIVESWLSMTDFDRHVASDHARSTRGTLQPLLASPFDERMFRSVK